MITNDEIAYIQGMVDKFVWDAKYKDDLRQEILLVVCEQPKERIKELRKNGTLFAFVYGIIRNQFFSGTSPFYKKYKLYDTMRQELDKYKQ